MMLWARGLSRRRRLRAGRDGMAPTPGRGRSGVYQMTVSFSRLLQRGKTLRSRIRPGGSPGTLQ
ncbi:hypothetical protein CMEL01_05150 [Colletotrichum melonis]|uniref:Uncharacterized protein n=1 Tax=Colletotrichum melonis TaxID=1209925 RepID=A0AAI9U844_9PEZI|nr:hypothetical protein CMEL01_05150 [Colletotrichum melonis]